jgi:inosine/xanthosine triphosphatase
MLIALGSLNKVKIESVREAFKEFGFDTQVVAVNINYKEQPLGLEETLDGAIYRAKTAFNKVKVDYGVGVEAGIISILGYNLNIQIAAITNENITSIGFSPAFQLPSKIESIVLKGVELDKAVEMIYGIKDIGEKGGIIELMSKGIIDRKSLIIYALKMAIVKIINNE